MKKTSRILATLMMIIMLVSTMTAFVFAEEPAEGATPGTEQAQENTTPAADPAQEAAEKAASEEAAAIRKYGYYHGKDATKIPVLTYHMVVSDSQKKSAKFRHSSLAVSKSTFDKQMKWLHKKGYRSISCEEFYLWYHKKIKLPPKSVMITFDDGAIGVAKYALPVLQKYRMHGVTFIVGSRTYKNKKGTIKYKQLQKLMQDQTYLEYQSHTYNLHKHFSAKGDYQKVLKDAAKQKKMYGFEYLAYPYGRNTKGMRKAYAESGIKIAFTYGKNGYATRSQNYLQIRRIKVNARESFSKFTRWFKG